jgi:hypothetical protein
MVACTLHICDRLRIAVLKRDPALQNDYDRDPQTGEAIRGSFTTLSARITERLAGVYAAVLTEGIVRQGGSNPRRIGDGWRSCVRGEVIAASSNGRACEGLRMPAHHRRCYVHRGRRL